MRDYTEYLTQVNKDVFAAVKESQDAGVAALEAMRQLAIEFVPAVPKAGSEAVPAATQLVEKSFDFAAKLLAIQKEYALRVAQTLVTVQNKAVVAKG